MPLGVFVVTRRALFPPTEVARCTLSVARRNPLKADFEAASEMAATTATTKSDSAPVAGIRTRLYQGWLELAAHFGEIQTLLIICFVYVFVMGPMALAASATRRDLLAKRGFEGSASAWCDADSTTQPDLERAKRLF
jgi:hypothetical protein